MTRSLILAAALALGVTLTGASTASAGGGHHGGHHHGGHHHHHGHHHYHGGFYGGIVVRPQPIVVPSYSYDPYCQPYGSGYGYGYGYPYGGYGPSGVGFSNRNFSLWLGR